MAQKNDLGSCMVAFISLVRRQKDSPFAESYHLEKLQVMIHMVPAFMMVL